MEVNSESKYTRQQKIYKALFKVFLGYVALLALILALTIISIFITFTLVVIDSFTEFDLSAFADSFFVPKSELLWNLFTKLVPGL